MSANLLIYGINPILKVLELRPDALLNLYVFRHNTKNKEIEKIISLCNSEKIKYINEFELSSLLDEIKTKHKISHQKIFARIKAKKNLDLSNLLNDANFNFCMILDGVTDANNLGAIIRNLISFDTPYLILPKDRSVSIDEAIYKTSVGEIESLNYIFVTNINETIKKLKENGFWIYGFENINSTLVWDHDYSGKVCFVLGGEASGIRDLPKKNLDFIVRIPISSNSLNVASSSAIALYEYKRSRLKPQKN